MSSAERCAYGRRRGVVSKGGTLSAPLRRARTHGVDEQEHARLVCVRLAHQQVAGFDQAPKHARGRLPFDAEQFRRTLRFHRKPFDRRQVLPEHRDGRAFDRRQAEVVRALRECGRPDREGNRRVTHGSAAARGPLLLSTSRAARLTFEQVARRDLEDIAERF